MSAAARDGVSVSAWMTEAARRSLVVRDGLEAIGEWERVVDPGGDGDGPSTGLGGARTEAQALGMTTVYDTGVLIAASRNDRNVWADHRARLEAGVVHITTAPVIAQASRSPRQAQLRRFLRGCDVVGFEPGQAHAVGTLLAKSDTTDVVDALVAVTAARSGATVITSDLDDLEALSMHTRPRITIRTVG